MSYQKNLDREVEQGLQNCFTTWFDEEPEYKPVNLSEQLSVINHLGDDVEAIADLVKEVSSRIHVCPVKSELHDICPNNIQDIVQAIEDLDDLISELATASIYCNEITSNIQDDFSSFQKDSIAVAKQLPAAADEFHQQKPGQQFADTHCWLDFQQFDDHKWIVFRYLNDELVVHLFDEKTNTHSSGRYFDFDDYEEAKEYYQYQVAVLTNQSLPNS